MKSSILIIFSSFLFFSVSSAEKAVLPPTKAAAAEPALQFDKSKKVKVAQSSKPAFKAPRKVLPPAQRPAPSKEGVPKSLEEQIKDADQSDLDQGK